MDVKTAKRAKLMVSLAGGEVSIINADGEVIATQGMQSGRHDASQFVQYMQKGDTLQFDGGISVLVPDASRVKPMKYGQGSHDSGANPDFVVTSADRHRRELDMMMSKLSAKTKDIDRKIASLNELGLRKGVAIEVAKEEEADVLDNGDIDDDTGGVLPDGGDSDVRKAGDDGHKLADA